MLVLAIRKSDIPLIMSKKPDSRSRSVKSAPARAPEAPSEAQAPTTPTRPKSPSKGTLRGSWALPDARAIDAAIDRVGGAHKSNCALESALGS